MEILKNFALVGVLYNIVCIWGNDNTILNIENKLEEEEHRTTSTEVAIGIQGRNKETNPWG